MRNLQKKTAASAKLHFAEAAVFIYKRYRFSVRQAV